MAANLREFARLWTEYKQANGLMDFTDLIETCMRDVARHRKNHRSFSQMKPRT